MLIFVLVVFFIYSLMCLGMFVDHRRHCVALEVTRLILLLLGPSLYPGQQYYTSTGLELILPSSLPPSCSSSGIYKHDGPASIGHHLTWTLVYQNDFLLWTYQVV